MKNVSQYVKWLNESWATEEEKKALESKFGPKPESMEIDEGMLDRFMAKASGKKSEIGQMLKNLPKAVRWAVTGQTPKGGKNPKVVKMISTILARNTKATNVMKRVILNYTSDLEALFGETLEDAPKDFQRAYADLVDTFDALESQFKVINKRYEALLSDGNPEKKQEENPTEPPL